MLHKHVELYLVSGKGRSTQQRDVHVPNPDIHVEQSDLASLNRSLSGSTSLRSHTHSFYHGFPYVASLPLLSVLE